MAASGRLTGILLAAAGLILAIAGSIWLALGVRDGKLESTGAVFGGIILAVIVLPLIGAGIYFLVSGQAEARDLAKVQQQRRLLDIVNTRGQVQISDLV